jgi:hypothetical protein
LVLGVACGGDDGGQASSSDESSGGSTTTVSSVTGDVTASAGEGTMSATSLEGTSEGSSSGDPQLPPPPTTIEETLAIYGAAWNEPDVERRRALLELAWADDGSYRDPTVVAEGREALVEAISAYQAGFPGAALGLTGDVDSHGTHVRFDWMITGPTELPGMDVGEIGDDLRLVRITGFFGPLPERARISTALQAYIDAWNENDEATRATLLASAVTDDVIYRDPTVEIAGADALSDHIAATRAMLGDATLALALGPDAYGPVMRFTWTIGDAASPVFSGLDMVTLADDGRLAEVTGFFD